MNVVAVVQSAWSQVKALAVPVDLTVDDATTDAALNRFQLKLLMAMTYYFSKLLAEQEQGKLKLSQMTWIMLLFQIFRYLQATTTSSKKLIYRKNYWLAGSLTKLV